jgi:hypothetical protein
VNQRPGAICKTVGWVGHTISLDSPDTDGQGKITVQLPKVLRVISLLDCLPMTTDLNVEAVRPP